MAGKLGRPPLALVLSGPWARKPTEAMIAHSQAAEEKRKRKAAAASTPKPATTATKGKPKPTTKATPTPSSPATDAPQCAAPEVIDEMPGSTPSATEVSVAEFMSQLDHSHHQGLDDLNFNGEDEDTDTTVNADYLAGEEEATEEAKEELTEVEAPRKGKKKKGKNTPKAPGKRSANYSEEEDVALCHAWMNVSLDAFVGADQLKETFWERIEDYYHKVVTVPSYRTQGSLGHRWGTILECCNRWAGAVEYVTNAPPSGVPMTEWGPLQQDVYKHRNKRGGGKAFTLHHCYKELQGNAKWVWRNYETTPKRTRISQREEDDDDEEEDLNKRPEGAKYAKEKKKRGGVGAYKEEFNAIIETKKALAAERKEDKEARCNELKVLEEEKWRSKLAVEERRIALEEERVKKEKMLEEEMLALEREKLAKEREDADRNIMFMNPSTLDDKARAYWEIARARFLARESGGDGRDGAHGG